MNLTGLRPIRALVYSRWFPVAPQCAVLLIYAALIAGAMPVDSQLRGIGTTNLASHLVWTVWWPVVLLLTILVGRVWCVVCPLELVSSLAARVGLKKTAPPLLSSGWAVTILFAFLLFFVMRSWQVRLNPRRTAIYMLGMLGLAAVVGLIYRRRAFCSYVCPISGLLATYSRTGCLDWTVEDPSVCKSCRTHDCAAPARYYGLGGRSCASGLFPPQLAGGKDCLLCTQCAKVCPHENLKLSLRRPGFALFGPAGITAAEIGLLVVITAYLNGGGPRSLYYVAAPLLAGLMLPIRSPKDFIKAYFIALLPLAALAYLQRGLGELLWGMPSLRFALADPWGTHTAELIHSGALKIDASGIEQPLLWMRRSMAVLRAAGLATAVLMVFRGRLSAGIGRAGKATMLAGIAAFYAATYHLKDIERLWGAVARAIGTP